MPQSGGGFSKLQRHNTPLLGINALPVLIIATLCLIRHIGNGARNTVPAF